MHWHVLLGKIMSSRNLHRKGWVSNTYCHILSKHRIKLSQLRPTKMMATTRRALDSIRALKVNRKLIQCYFELLNVAVLGSLSACLYLTSKFNIKSWTAESSLVFYVQYKTLLPQFQKNYFKCDNIFFLLINRYSIHLKIHVPLYY